MNVIVEHRSGSRWAHSYCREPRFYLKVKEIHFKCFLLIFIIFIFCSLGLHLWHLEVPRLGVESELQLLGSAKTYHYRR